MSLFNYPSGFDSAQGASIFSLPSPFLNKSLAAEDLDEIKNEIIPEENDYVKLAAGTNIYFYTTEDESLIIGPKLRCEGEVPITIVDQGENMRNGTWTKTGNMIKNPVNYVALKSGVLVPQLSFRKKKEFESIGRHEKCNKCVYQSLMPVYYIKGFRNILIPVDVLYSKTKQHEFFDCKNLQEKSLLSSNVVKQMKKSCDPKMENLEDDELIADKSSSMQISLDSDNKNEIDLKAEVLEKPATNSDSKRFSSYMSRDIGSCLRHLPSDESLLETLPDKTCNGDVTLFVLKSDGIFKRIAADPYMPMGIELTYSLLSNLVFRPKFLGGSKILMSYVTGENGDLIPHSDNLHKITAQVGSTVSFMLSKNGGLFPVKEEKKQNNAISYYYKGQLVHESQQFTQVYSNSTSVLINDKNLEIFGSANDSENRTIDENYEENEEKPVHRLRKREVYLNGYGRSGSDSVHEQHSPIRKSTLSADRNRMVEYQSSPMRGQTLFNGRHAPPAIGDVPSDAKYPEASDGISQGISKVSPISPCEICAGSSSVLRTNNVQQYPGPTEGQLQEPVADSITSSQWESSSQLRPRSDIFIFDEKGIRIRLIPEITDNNDVVIYKLTCKGNLVRYPPCKEPEYGFEINFQLLLDEFVLVPTISSNSQFQITYVLQENGDLTPAECNINTFRKAPGSLIYYILGKNNVLFPVQQVIDMEGNVSFYYQDFFLLKMRDSVDKPLHFSTKGSPLFAFFNGFTIISISSKPRLNTRGGSNWNHLKPSDGTESLPKTMYLTGPKGELIRISPYINKQGATVVYELDCNGILYRSPKDKKKCIILKSYILLKEGILLPSNDTNGYVYMMSKNGDLFPYLYPEGKIEAPLASSLKYVLCEKGILLPIKLEIMDNSVCYLFRDVVIYKERVYTKSCLDRLDGEQLDRTLKYKKSSCEMQTHVESDDKMIRLFVNKNGDNVFYEKCDKILKRNPPELVPPYLKYTMGSFQVKPDGSLYQIRYQDPNENVVNLMLEPNGDLLEDTRNINNVRSQYYVLDARGNLISVEARKTRKSIHFYKGSVKVCKVPIPNHENIVPVIPVSEPPKTPLGKDPLRLMADPFPEKSESERLSGDDPNGDARSLYIPIPLKSVSVSNSADTCTECADAEHKKRCDLLNDTLKQFSKGNSLPLALELELTDEIIEELKNWAAKCSKVLN